MPTDLAHHIQTVRVIDTHEHMQKEEQWTHEGPKDLLETLFRNYAYADLV